MRKTQTQMHHLVTLTTLKHIQVVLIQQKTLVLIQQQALELVEVLLPLNLAVLQRAVLTLYQVVVIVQNHPNKIAIKRQSIKLVCYFILSFIPNKHKLTKENLWTILKP